MKLVRPRSSSTSAFCSRASVSASIALVASALAITSFAFGILAWKQRYWSFAGRVHYTIVTLAALTFIWLLNDWNLLGFKF